MSNTNNKYSTSNINKLFTEIHSLFIPGRIYSQKDVVDKIYKKLNLTNTRVLFKQVITANDRELSQQSKNNILLLLKYRKNIYKIVVQLLQNHLQWLNIYCSALFVNSNNKNYTPNNKNIQSMDSIKLDIINYMKFYHNFQDECSESTSIDDLISYDETDKMSNKLQAVYLFMSVLRLGQSQKTSINDKYYYCILLNEFIKNLKILLTTNNTSVPLKNSKLAIVPFKLKTGEEYDIDVGNSGIKKYGKFILDNIINKLFIKP
jgi:hypothetical protein